MVCPSCNKFPSFDISEPELDSLECEGGVVTGSVRLALTTQCCGDEVKESTFEIDLDLSDQILDKLKAAGIENPDLDGENVEFEVTSESANGDDRYENKDRHGKPIKSMRYMKHFYCVTVGVTVKCTYPVKDADSVEVEVDGTWNDEIQASAMDEMC